MFTVGPKRTAITALAWRPTGHELAVGGNSGLLQLSNLAGAPWPLTSTFAGLQQQLEGVPEAIQSIAFSPDGRLLAASDETELQPALGPGSFDNRWADLAIWRTSTRKPLVTLQYPVPGGTPAVLAFSRDSRLLAVSPGPGDFTQVLDPSTLHTRRTLPSPGVDDVVSLAFASDGTLATGTSGGTVRMWNPTNDQIANPFVAAAAPITSVAFDATGRRFATSGAQDGAVRLWFTSPLQQEVAAPSTDHDATSTAAFDSHTGTLLAVDNRGNALTWPTSPAVWEQQACAIAGRNLTRQEWARFIPGQSYAKVCP